MNEGSMLGKRVIITGATAGIGEAAAVAIAAKGANVEIVARSEEKAKALCSRLSGGKGTVRYHIGDLSRMADVRAVAQSILADATPIDVLVNNAGVMNIKRQVTSEGFEHTFALNHLSYFLLTHLLLDRIKAAPEARIVCTASAAHLMIDDMRWDDLQLEKTWRRRGWDAYCQSKLGNVLFVKALARRLEGTNVRINAVHPGFVRSELGRNNGTFARIAVPLIGLFGARSPEKGADTIVWLATAPNARAMHGEYMADRKPARVSKAALDGEKQERLYRVTAELVGVSV